MRETGGGNGDIMSGGKNTKTEEKNRKPILNNCFMGKVDFVLNSK